MTNTNKVIKIKCREFSQKGKRKMKRGIARIVVVAVFFLTTNILSAVTYIGTLPYWESDGSTIGLHNYGPTVCSWTLNDYYIDQGKLQTYAKNEINNWDDTIDATYIYNFTSAQIKIYSGLYTDLLTCFPNLDPRAAGSTDHYSCYYSGYYYTYNRNIKI